MIEAENVLENPLAFKAKLAIGEDAYKSLKYGKGLQGAWDALGVGATAAGIAKTSAVAGLIGSKVGFLSFIGIGSFVTPLPYVALAAVGSTAAYIGVIRVVRNFSKDRVDIIPKFINSPLDILAVSLFDLLAPLTLKVAFADGDKSASEHDLIVEYFSKDWGYARDYVEQSLKLLEDQILEVEVEHLLKPVSDFIAENPDCNQIEIAKNILEVLKEIAEVDGILTDDEVRVLDISEEHFKDANSFVKKLTTPINALTQKMKFRNRSG